MIRLKRNSEVIWDQIDGATVLCHTETGEFFRLNRVGSFIWEACNECTISSLIEQLLTIYPTEDHKQITAHLQQFIQSLENAGLLINE
jgi:hypothetical protein